MEQETDLDSQKILEKAQELLDTDKNEKDISQEEEFKGSYDNENEFEENKSIEEEDSLRELNELGNETDKFANPKQGYSRQIHFKKPGFFKFFIGILTVVVLIYIISLLLPYIPNMR